MLDGYSCCVYYGRHMFHIYIFTFANKLFTCTNYDEQLTSLRVGKLSCAIREIRKERNVTIYKQGKKSLNVIIKCIILHDITSIRAYVFSYRERERVRRLQSEKKIIVHTIYQPVYIMRLVRMCVPIFLNLCKSLCFFGRCWKNNPHLLPHKRISLCETFFL